MKKGGTNEYTHLFFALFLFFIEILFFLEIRIECYDGWRNLFYREPSRLAQASLPAFYKRL